MLSAYACIDNSSTLCLNNNSMHGNPKTHTEHRNIHSVFRQRCVCIKVCLVRCVPKHFRGLVLDLEV